jgi:S1-C subfamily serine protease
MDRIWVHPAELSPVRPQSWARTRLARLVPAVAAGALGALVAVLVLGMLGAFDGDGEREAASDPVQVLSPVDAAVSRLVEAVAPGLVVVTVKDGRGTRQASGVCVRHSGDVIASAQVIGDATAVEITTSEGETVNATVVGRDVATDLALLGAERPLRAVPISETRGQAGDSVWVFGALSERETTPWISSGILSSTNSIVAETLGPTTAGLFETDALGTMWSAGGALVDRSAAVSAIVIAPTTSSRSTHAVPIRSALRIADELREKGWVAHGAMPIEGFDTPTGPTVTGIPGGSPAGAAGVVPGDVIVSIGGREIVDLAHLTAVVHGYPPGTTVEVELLRGAEPLKVDVTLGATAPEPAGS